MKREAAVDRQSIDYFLRAFDLQLAQGDCAPPTPPFEELALRQSNSQHDWGGAIDVSLFFGQDQENAQLQQWVLTDHCRLIALLGIGGMGKSSLSVKLARQVQTEFTVVVWRSLQNASTLEELLTSLLSFLLPLQDKDTTIPTSLNGKLTALIDCLQQQRCLLILDNAETLLESGCSAGQFRAGYETYGQLFRTMGEVPHQSCVVLTSREKLREIALLEGDRLPVRSLQLTGLSPQEGRSLVECNGQFTGSDAEWSQLVEHYRGNPLALKMVGRC